MPYSYGEIISFRPYEFSNVAAYFSSFNDTFLKKMMKVEEADGKIQSVFNMYHPNVSLNIFDVKFDISTGRFSMPENIILSLNGYSVNLNMSNVGVSTKKDSVVLESNHEDGEPYLDDFFCKKDVSAYDVFWWYDTSSTEIPSEYDDYGQNDILPYNVLASSFFTKANEDFTNLYSGTLSIDDRTAFSKDIGETFFNNLSNYEVHASFKEVVGDSIWLTDYTKVSFVNPVDIESGSVEFSKDFVFSANSITNSQYIYSNFAKKDLSNVTAFNVRNEDLSDRQEKEVVSNTNFNDKLSTLYDISINSVSDVFKVYRSIGDDAATFKSLHTVIFTFLSNFYGEKLRLYLSDYTGLGELEVFIRYIEEKIDDLNASFVTIDECELPIRNIDEGCEVSCDNIHFEETHLMVTKQKLKSTVRCLLECDTMPYTENDLAGRTIPLNYGHGDVFSPPPQPTV